MTFELQEFSIHGLHGVRTLRIPIKGNKLILVGINGLGKTTVTTILYRLLSRQWARLLDFKFERLTLRFSQETLTFNREEIASGLMDWSRLRRFFPTSIINQFKENQELIPILLNPNKAPTDTAYLAEQLDISPPMLDRLLSLPLHIQRDLFDSHNESSAIQAVKNLSQHVKQQVLYLPTYRRIERDLKAIFPKLEEQVRRFHKTTEAQTSHPPHYIELVEFGMEDVATKFASTITTLKETTRAELNAVVGTYLREVIRGEARIGDVSKIQGLNDSTISRILNRVEERTLNRDEKNRLREIILQIKSKASTKLTVEDAYIARFFSKLVTLDQVLSSRESSIQSFIEVCSNYLRGKSFTYDEQNYTINLNLDSGRTMELRDLSSGEKQIVSLFAHLYLEQNKNFIVIIDEPELSLSVDWQRKLLPDIVNSGRCEFLAAATHSPYVFDNELEWYAQDLAECMEEG